MSDDNPPAPPDPTAAERMAFYDRLLTALGPDLAGKFILACKHMIDTGTYGEVGIVIERGRPKRIRVQETYEP